MLVRPNMRLVLAIFEGKVAHMTSSMLWHWSLNLQSIELLLLHSLLPVSIELRGVILLVLFKGIIV